jgi:PAS domain S-box-containing protein
MKKRILIADDSPIIRNIVGSVIVKMGYDLILAEDGIEGVEKAFSALPDLIVLDISMPRLNGFQACRLLKNDPQTSHIPIIILTGEQKPVSQFWGKEVGADSYIVKSNDIEPLANCIEQLLKDHGRKKSSAPAQQQPPLTETKILGKISELLDKELEKSTYRKMELESIHKNINEAIIIIDRNNRIKEINEYGLHLFDLSNRDLEKMTIFDIFPEKDFLSFNSLISRNSWHEYREKEITYTSRSHPHTLLLNFSLINNFQSETESIVIFFKDISYIKEMEKMKAEYFYNIFQEIRNPLSSAKQALPLLKDSSVSLNGTQQSALKIIEDETNRLIRFTDTIFNISGMELTKSQLNIEPTDIGFLLQSAYLKKKAMAQLKNITLTIEPPPEKAFVLGDREKLTEIFSNIFSNAIKYNRINGSITVSVKRTDISGRSYVSVFIRDTGFGMDKNDIQLLFDKEKKVDARLRKKGGEFGLSLVIAKMLIDLHEGFISAESIPGEGSTFTLSLPLMTKDSDE